MSKKMRRGSLVLLVVVLLFVSMASPVMAAEKPINIIIDNQLVYSDAPPIIKSSRVLVPVRVVSERLGFIVSWHENDQTIYITKGQVTAKLIIGQNKIWINGYERTIDVTPVVINGRSYLPIRAVSEIINASVVWDSGTRSVIVNTGKESVSSSSKIDIVDEQTIIFSTIGNPINNINIFQLDNPYRLVIDFDQMLVEELNIPELQESGLVKEIRYSQFGLDPNKVRVVLDLKYKVNYNYQISYDTLTLILKPYVYKVVLDAGHGGKDPGAIGVSGTYEKTLNLALTLKLAYLLRNNPLIEVILTRSSDVYLSLDDRVVFANAVSPDIFLSIHHNSIPNKSSVNGVETYYTRPDSYKLATTVHKYLIGSTGFANRGVGTANFRVIKYTNMPAALVEVGYLSNRTEEQIVRDPFFQDNVALSLESALLEYFNIK